MTRPLLGHRLVVMSDAHLGVTPPAVEERLLAFLEAVPTLGDCLLINGDLFDFWFSYAYLIPRRGIHVVAALAQLRRRVPIVLIGGNHDRWGGDFWEHDLGLTYVPFQTTFRIGQRGVLALHGDGVTDHRRRARLVHRLIHHPLTAAIYRLLHPELGFRLVDRLSPMLGDQTANEATLELAARLQRTWAESTLAADPSLGLVIMSHTHRAALSDTPAGSHYLNPGAWFDGFRYAIATETGAELCRFGAAPAAARVDA